MSDTCPRCTSDHVGEVARSAVEGAWTVFSCVRCGYSWRSSEPASRASAEAYPPEFAMSDEQIDSARDVPAIPPRQR